MMLDLALTRADTVRTRTYARSQTKGLDMTYFQYQSLKQGAERAPEPIRAAGARVAFTRVQRSETDANAALARTANKEVQS